MDQSLHNNVVRETAAESNPQPTEAGTTAATSSSSESSSDFANDPSLKHCSNCNKLEEDPETPLKECIKCHSTLYCSRDCQKADFKKHKKNCASLAQAHAQTSGPSRMQVTRAPPKKGGGAKGLQKWQFDT